VVTTTANGTQRMLRQQYHRRNVTETAEAAGASCSATSAGTLEAAEMLRAVWTPTPAESQATLLLRRPLMLSLFKN
jgi:hypothetical protein